MTPGHAKHQRKPKQTARRAPTREPYDKVLIVCEGQKTEPNYFRDLIRWHDVSSVNVQVSGAGGAAPTSVVQHGIELYEQERRYGEPYDRVYCVFDRDSYHLTSQGQVYQKAFQAIQDARPSAVYFAANSIPCFEYWLLLHFVETNRGFAAQGNASVGKMVERELSKYWPSYEKGLKQPYQALKKIRPDGEAAAIRNARRALRQVELTGEENPSTQVHQLVEYLTVIKGKSRT